MTEFANAEQIEAYQRIMDGDVGRINIQVGSGNPDSIARGVGESLRKYAFAARTPVQTPPTHAKPMPASALNHCWRHWR